MNNDFTIRRISIHDVPDVVDAALEFFSESDQVNVFTVSRQKYSTLLLSYMGHEYVASYIARDNTTGELAGYIHIYCQDDYTEEMVGELYQFYVRSKYRGTGVARQLVDAANEQYKRWGCVRAYAEVGHGTTNRSMGEKLFCNLWSKFGYQPMGTVMKKEYK